MVGILAVSLEDDAFSVVSSHIENLQTLEIRDTTFSAAALKLMTAPWLSQLKKIVLYEYPKKPDFDALKTMFENTPTVCAAH